MKKKENAPTRAMSMTKDLMIVYCSITYSRKMLIPADHPLASLLIPILIFNLFRGAVEEWPFINGGLEPRSRPQDD
jgi:hypothetical protein